MRLLFVVFFLLSSCSSDDKNEPDGTEQESNTPVELSYSSSSYTEDSTTFDGTMNETITVTVSGDEFALLGSLTEGTHYSVSNLPTGGVLTVNVITATTAEISFSGVRANNANDNTSNMNLSFATGAFSNAVLPEDGSESHTFSVNFLNPLVLFHAGTTNGNMGGILGATSTCQAEQTALGLPHANVIPFFSSGSNDEVRDMPINFTIQTSYPIESATGVKVVDDWVDLLDGTIDTSLSSASVLPSSSYWWSGSRDDGVVNLIDTCSTWSTSGPITGTTGYSESTSSSWIFFNLAEDCFLSSNYLLCLAYD